MFRNVSRRNTVGTREYAVALGYSSILLIVLWAMERFFPTRKGIFIGGSEVVVEIYLSWH